MKKGQSETWEIAEETVTAIGAAVFFGLQFYYGYVYKSSAQTLLYHLLPIALLYAGLTTLQIYPELLNGGNSERLHGRVRIYAVRMMRNTKMFFMLGILAPSVADVAGVTVNAGYSLFVMAGILIGIGYYLYRIYRYNSKEKK